MNDRTPIINISDDIINRDFKIEELSNKREILSNNVNKIKRNKFKLKEILKEGKKRNRTEFGVEDKIYTLLQMYHIK